MYYQQYISGINGAQLLIIRAKNNQSCFSIKKILWDSFQSHRYLMISAVIYLALFVGFKEWVVAGHKTEIFSFSACDNIIRLPPGGDGKPGILEPKLMSKLKTPGSSVKPEITLPPVKLAKPVPRVTAPNPVMFAKPVFTTLNPALSIKPVFRVSAPSPAPRVEPVACYNTSILWQGKTAKYTIEAGSGCSGTGGSGLSGSGGEGFSGAGGSGGGSGFSGYGGYSPKPQDMVIDPKIPNIGNMKIISITLTLTSDAYNIPDTFQVIYQDHIYLNTGSTDGWRSNKILINTSKLLNAGSGQLIVRVISHWIETTQWEWHAKVEYVLAPV